MASNKIIRIGPGYLSNSVANIVNPPTLTGGTGLAGTNAATYLILRHITIANKTTSNATYTLYIGATGASAGGTEFMGKDTTVPANGRVEWVGILRLDTADFLTGVASAASTLVFEAEGEIGVL